MVDAHDFKENKEIEGVYTRKQENIGENESMLYTLKLDSGELKAVWGSTVLDNQMSNVEFGQKIRITFLGKVDSEKRKGKQYNNFMVEVWEDELESGFKN